MEIILPHILLVLTALLGSITTYLFHNKYDKINPVFASASLTLIVAILCHILPSSESIPLKQIPYVFIGSTFIGMSTRKIVKKPFYIILASFFYILIYFKSSQFFQGYGGALGVSACISVLIVITSSKLFIRSKYYYLKRANKKQKESLLK